MNFAVPLSSSTRRATPSHQPWVPLPYMLKAVEHLESRGSAGLALDPGLRKTSITLEAFRRLKERSLVRTMLVVAPLRVCRTVWRQEGAKWSEFRHLKFSLLHGPKKSERLKDAADVYLINPEGVVWLSKQFALRSLPFDIVVIDELTKFKNHSAERCKALRPRLKGVARRWGLTGSLAPNGWMDIFGQQLMLDNGAALGKYITHYRDSYFQVDWNGFDYTLQPGAERRIIARIAPYWLQMSADDYMQLPELIQDPRYIELEQDARATYEKMKRDMIASLPEGVVTAANAAATYSKLSQMANGAVYAASHDNVAHIHDGKLDAIEELMEELNGQPLLVAYEFNHDLNRLRERFGADLPHLGKGTTVTQEAEYIARWNRNELPILACHPASAGHGLNLQEGNAAHVCWFGITWDLELYDQFIRRIRRSGNISQRIFNHLLIVRNSIDELKLAALSDKDLTQTRLLKALNTEILGDTAMTITKLSRSGGAAATEAPAKITPKGWGAPQAEAQPAQVDNGQRDRIATQLRGNGSQPNYEAAEAPAAQARSAFSGAVQQQLKQLEAPPGEADRMAKEVDDAADKKRTRTRRTTEPDTQPVAGKSTNGYYAAERVALLTLVFTAPAFETAIESVEDGIKIAEELRKFVEG